ncbi:hypothetical protein [endosymbiont 'TC1' of Trimyema compressum]|uniref:hypothetical protein n=1 Tax=endosymbiont 'TC1' of Trimyema compressum TaxID=243899 RepID=UPI001392383F|nr:hypothetical protein [endosymbiont 'TC1' of Trimyema compressum]
MNEEKVEDFIFSPVLNSQGFSLDKISEKYGFIYEARQEKELTLKLMAKILLC